jgi:Flp pilus assembly protein TadG
MRVIKMALELRSPVPETPRPAARRRGERGAALIEAAMIIPVLLLIAAGIFEFGRAYQHWQVLTNAAREGARFSVTPTATNADVEAVIREYMRIGGLEHHATATVNVDRMVALAGTATASQIVVDYPFEFIVLQPIVALVDGGDGPPSIELHGRALMRNEAP